MIGDRLRRKRLAFGLSLQDLAENLGQNGITLSRATLSNYENSKAIPNAKTLWGIAKILGVSMDYFVEEQNLTIELQGFRKKSRATKSSVERITATILDEIEKRMELDSILGEVGPSDPPLQKKIGDPAEAEVVAIEQRERWKVGSQPISSVSALLESKGWYVLEAPSDPDFDGMAGFVVADHRPFVVSRGGIAIDRFRLNLLHEAGHAFVAGADEKASEKAAFRFAASFLFPKERVFEEFGHKRSSIDIDELMIAKQRYGLSMQAIIFRLKDLDIISKSYFSLLFTWFNRMNYRIEEPGSESLKFQEVPMAFTAKVHRALAEGFITESDAQRFIPGFRPSAEPPSRITSTEIKRILSLPTEERDAILSASADAVMDTYRDPEVNISGLVDDALEYS